MYVRRIHADPCPDAAHEGLCYTHFFAVPHSALAAQTSNATMITCSALPNLECIPLQLACKRCAT